MVKGCQSFMDEYDGEFEKPLFDVDLATIEPLTRETRDNRPGLNALREAAQFGTQECSAQLRRALTLQTRLAAVFGTVAAVFCKRGVPSAAPNLLARCARRSSERH